MPCRYSSCATTAFFTGVSLLASTSERKRNSSGDPSTLVIAPPLAPSSNDASRDALLEHALTSDAEVASAATVRERNERSERKERNETESVGRVRRVVMVAAPS